MVKAADPIGPYQNAKALAALGLQVLPALYADKLKAPTVKWTAYQTQRIGLGVLKQWFDRPGNKNYWVLCGALSGVVVIDTDNAAADAWWRSELGDELLDSTTSVKTARGRHYWFKIPAGWTEPVKSWSKHPLGADAGDEDALSFDFRGEGGGVIAPPSVHESGLVYSWSVPFSEIKEAPPGLLDGAIRAKAPGEEPGGARRTAGGGGASGVTRIGPGGRAGGLADLLSSPPAEGGRNVWMTNIAGHYATEYRNAEDLFLTQCRVANSLLDTPLDPAELDKILGSIWRTEQGKPVEAVRGVVEFNAENGWLRGTGRRLMTQTRHQDPETGDIEYPPAEWANFDIKAIGVSETQDGGEADYWVRVFREVGPVDVILSGKVLGDTGRLNTWLSALRVSILPPDNIYPRTGGYGTRLQRYLESQEPPHTSITRVLGWHPNIMRGAGGFVTHKEIITAAARVAFADAGVRPDPALQSQGLAAHDYGFGPPKNKKEARRVLREVLTYQDETACSVFGAWWAACLLKPQIQQAAALFPFMAIEAPSESGKTTGFFNMMIQMNGNTRGETIPTVAVMRSMAAAHSNGIVWVDDLDDASGLTELLRASTANGTVSKMSGTAWDSSADFRIVSPIVLSGESLGMGKQKALQDRAVSLAVSSPVGRMSLHDPARKQWDDILAMRAAYPNGLHVLAGWYVQMALQHASATLQTIQESKAAAGKGRNADKNAILLGGAMLLDCLTATSATQQQAAWAGGGAHYARVLKWVMAQVLAYNDLENALTLEVLPWAISHYGEQTTPRHSDQGDHTPVWIESDPASEQLGGGGGGLCIRFNTRLLAAAWKRSERGGRVESRTHSADALNKQAMLVKDSGKGLLKRLDNGSPQRWMGISGDLAQTILGRARS